MQGKGGGGMEEVGSCLAAHASGLGGRADSFKHNSSN
jgi:hypothetical protein